MQNATQTGGYSLSTPSLGYAYISQIEAAPYKSAGGQSFGRRNTGPVHDLQVGMDIVTSVPTIIPVCSTRQAHRHQSSIRTVSTSSTSFLPKESTGRRAFHWM